ncbi:MAG: hypothetical protein Q4B06_02140 [Candidatus Saccharibacteria bacterium]|nr:hypothetical protein [Candidatus Saccharibacteria bacterium]
MNTSGSGARDKIAEVIRGAETLLVTVSKHPSVDELSAALGITMQLNEMGKHATAVVSGDLPSAITFLEPEKTFKNSVDSLRDFVIALDKEKADHLRYKVEGDVVKIFITPYKTVITEKDLEYSQGDYNVETVLAIGVTEQKELDAALESHGRILHDATVATIGLKESTLGSVSWHDAGASSVSEMAAGLVEALKDDKPVAEQVASALLTGIVAATERFSNDKTNATVMTAAAKLMSYGANQQLIAAKLQEQAGKKPVAKPAATPTDTAKKDAVLEVKKDAASASSEKVEHKSAEKPAAAAKEPPTPAVKKADAQKPQPDSDKPVEESAVTPAVESTKPTKESAPVLPTPQLPTPEVALPTVATDTPHTEAKPATPTMPAAPSGPSLPPVVPPLPSAAPAEPAAPVADALQFEATPVVTPPPTLPAAKLADELAKEAADTNPDAASVAGTAPSGPSLPPIASPEVTLAELDAQHRQPTGNATPHADDLLQGVRDEVKKESAITPGFNLPPLPPMPDFAQLPPLPPAPDFSQLPPLPTQPEAEPDTPAQPLGAVLPPLPKGTAVTPPPATPADPGQFKIPGQ